MPSWDRELRAMEQAVESGPPPAVNAVKSRRFSPWDILVSTIISLRTKDAVTLSSSLRLLAEAPDPAAMAALEEERIAELIYPAGFYRVKAANLRKIAGILLRDCGGSVPQTLAGLIALPGVGPKTANLVLAEGFGIPAICVDIHVHRIANRRGWIRTLSPEESEENLRRILPARWWIPLNRILVAYGQRICTPVSPLCSRCPVSGDCPRVGVKKHR